MTSLLCNTAALVLNHAMVLLQAVLVHTEDACPEWQNYGYVVHANIKPTEMNGFTHERFVSFAYPGNEPLFVTLTVITRKKTHLFAPKMTSKVGRELFFRFLTKVCPNFVCQKEGGVLRAGASCSREIMVSLSSMHGDQTKHAACNIFIPPTMCVTSCVALSHSVHLLSLAALLVCALSTCGCDLALLGALVNLNHE